MAAHAKDPATWFWKTRMRAGLPLTDAQLEQRRAYDRDYYARSGGRETTAAKRARLKYRYGLSLEEYEQMMVEQKYSCAICGLSAWEARKNLNIDHNHETGQIRGLLCEACNQVLGKMSEDPERLRAAADYLERFS